MLGKPNQEEENYVVFYQQKARDPWDRQGKGLVTSGKLNECLIVADLSCVGFLDLQPGHYRNQLN